MSTYKFKVSKPEDIDIPRICRENLDQDAFVILYLDKIYYAAKKELGVMQSSHPNWGGMHDPSVSAYQGFVFGWDYTSPYDVSAQERATTFFKNVAESRAEISQKKKKQLVTVIAKD